MNLEEVFDAVHSSASLGSKKPDQDLWQKLHEEVGSSGKENVLV